MRGRYFRYLFENLEEGLFSAGSIFDKEKQTGANFVYIAGGSHTNASQERFSDIYREKDDDIPEKIDILAVGAYSAKCINMIISFVKNHTVRTVFLPYLAPIQRLALLGESTEAGYKDTDLASFLQDPYQFLKMCGISKICFLLGNGTAVRREPEELEHAFCFERIDEETSRIIREMEGYVPPVMRAGYMIENGCLFYFGMYGSDIQLLSKFTKDYFSHIENIHEMSENADEDYIGQTKRLTREFLRKFGNAQTAAVVMFAGPLHMSPVWNDIFMAQKMFCRNKFCGVWEKCRKDENCACVIRCTYGKDHDVLQRYKVEKTQQRFGVWLLGNVNLNRYLPELHARFFKIIPRVRGIAVPNRGSGAEWNHQILRLFDATDRIYWICAKHDMTSAGVVSDIVLSSANQRFCPVDKDWGFCLSGYALPREDKR